MFDFKAFRFGKGMHITREDGMCIMEAVAYVSGEVHSDRPECACPVISSLVRSWNDVLPDEKRDEILSEFVFRLVGTKSTKDIEQERGIMALEWLINIFLPTILEQPPRFIVSQPANKIRNCWQYVAQRLKELNFIKANLPEIIQVLSIIDSELPGFSGKIDPDLHQMAWHGVLNAYAVAFVNCMCATDCCSSSCTAGQEFFDVLKSVVWRSIQYHNETKFSSASIIAQLQESAKDLIDRMIRLTEPQERTINKNIYQTI